MIANLKAVEDARPLLVTLPFRVQTYDVDWAGHVNNGVYVRWLEDLRLEMLEVHCPMKGLLDQGLAPILVRTEIDYLHPVKFFDAPVGHLWCDKMGRATMNLHAEICVEGRVCCRARQRGALLHADTYRPARFPARFAEAFVRTNCVAEKG